MEALRARRPDVEVAFEWRPFLAVVSIPRGGQAPVPRRRPPPSPTPPQPPIPPPPPPPALQR